MEHLGADLQRVEDEFKSLRALATPFLNSTHSTRHYTRPQQILDAFSRVDRRLRQFRRELENALTTADPSVDSPSSSRSSSSTPLDCPSDSESRSESPSATSRSAASPSGSPGHSDCPSDSESRITAPSTDDASPPCDAPANARPSLLGDAAPRAAPSTEGAPLAHEKTAPAPNGGPLLSTSSASTGSSGADSASVSIIIARAPLSCSRPRLGVVETDRVGRPPAPSGGPPLSTSSPNTGSSSAKSASATNVARAPLPSSRSRLGLETDGRVGKPPAPTHPDRPPVTLHGRLTGEEAAPSQTKRPSLDGPFRQSKRRRLAPDGFLEITVVEHLVRGTTSRESILRFMAVVRAWRGIGDDFRGRLSQVGKCDDESHQLKALDTLRITFWENSGLFLFLEMLASVHLFRNLERRHGIPAIASAAIDRLLEVRGLNEKNIETNRRSIRNELTGYQKWDRLCGESFHYTHDGILCFVPPVFKDYSDLSRTDVERLRNDELARFRSLLQEVDYVQRLCEVGRAFQMGIFGSAEFHKRPFEARTQKELSTLGMADLLELL